MLFSDLVSRVRMFEAQLVAATRQDAPTRQLRALMGRMSDLNDRMERHAPSSADEHRRMIAFFASRANRGPLSPLGDRDLDTVLRLVRDDVRPPARPDPVPRRGTGGADMLDTGVADPEDLLRHIAGSDDRLIVLDASNRYMATSPANARFNNSSVERMVDLHLEQVIGKRRYLDRAAPALDRAMAHGPWAYVYALPCIRDTRRYIRCDVLPMRDRAERLYCAIMRMRDVTSDVMAGGPA